MRSDYRWRWHFDETSEKVNGVQHYHFRALDHEAEMRAVQDSGTLDKKAVLTLPRRLMERHGRAEDFRTNIFKVDEAARKELGAEAQQVTGPAANNRLETSDQRFREREEATLQSRPLRSLQKIIFAHSSVHNLFNIERGLSSRSICALNRAAAFAE
jgi:putative transposase